jgi:carbon-monoxide dehydrogenase medium subunit
MKPAPFDLHRPATVDDALALLRAHHDDAKVLAGGQSLVPLLALRLATPAHLVDLGAVDELRTVSVEPDALRVGAMVTHATLARDDRVRREAPLLARAAAEVGHAAIRSRGTLGGSVAHADPAAEHPAVCVALGATLEIAGGDGRRLVPAESFFRSTFTTALATDEVLVAVRFPRARARHGAAVVEVARRHGDFALAGAAAWVELDGADAVTAAGLALFGVADRPWPGGAAAGLLVGTRAGAVDLSPVLDRAVDGLHPAGGVHASGRYLRHLARTTTERAVRAALEEARGG